MIRTPTLGRSPSVLAILPLLFLFASAAAADPATPPPTCTGHTITAYVVALDQVITLNRFGSQIPGGMIYALARDVFPTKPAPADYSEKNSCRFAACTAGNVQLRPDAPAFPGKRPRPLVLRVPEGDCLKIIFTNLLNPTPQAGSAPLTWLQPSTRTAGVHVQGLNWVCGPQDDGSNVGGNVSSLVPPVPAPTAATAPAPCTEPAPTTGTSVNTLYAEHEGAYLLYNTADDWSSLASVSANAVGAGDGGTLAEGFFGAVMVEPRGRQLEQEWRSEFYRSQVTEQDLCLASTDKVIRPDDPLHCARRHPHLLPVLNYQAHYPDKHPRAYLPILNMVCSTTLTPQAIANHVCEENELVHGDLTAMITGPSNPRLPVPLRQPQAFPHGKADDLPPSLRPIYAYPDRFQPFREFTVIYHESFQVTQAFATQINTQTSSQQASSLQAAEDNFGINYGMSGLSNEVLANRLGAGPLRRCVDCKFEEFFLSSWAMGDPAMNLNQPDYTCLTAPASKGCEQPKAEYPDDPSNVYHAYMSDHVRFRVLHAGPDLHHLHHQHAQQWLGTPNSPNGDYLDSQSIGPGSAFTMEMVYNGSGNVNQTVGDSIFHCHFYPHFASGMWSLWRVHDVFEGGTILDDQGYPADRTNPVTLRLEHTRALPDGEIQQGTPTVALVPLPTLPMAPMPAAVRLQGVCSNRPAKNCSFSGPEACHETEGFCIEMGSRYCVVHPLLGKCISEFESTDKSWDQVEKIVYPGYPFFVPGIGGSRPPHPPLDFAYACAKSGRICDPLRAEGLKEAAERAVKKLLLSELPRSDYQAPIFRDQVCQHDEGKCEPMDGGLPRAVTAQGPSSDWQVPQPPIPNLDFSKEITSAQAIELPETGTQIEKAAMRVHAQRFHFTQLPDGRKIGTCSDNLAPCTPGDLAQCRDPDRAICTPKPINFVLNGLGPKPGAPYADPCIRFDRRGGQPRNMLTRSYLAADLQLDAIFNREGWHFPQQRMLSLWGDVQAFLDRTKAPEPLFMRVNSYDCMTYVLANLVPNVYEQDDFQVRTPTDVIGQHIHLVKFDVTSSDGAENGWNYEDGTYAPNEVTERIRAINKAGGIYEAPGEHEPGAPCPKGLTGQRCLEAKYIKFFGPGPPVPGAGSETTGAWLGSQATVQRWYDDPLFNNTGRCSTDLTKSCTLGQERAGRCPAGGVCVTDAGFCSDRPKQPCTQADRHLCGSPQANCEPDHDRTIRTVFTHDHFGPSTHQQAGLYAGVVAEPKGSVWHRNEKGEIMGGYDAANNRNFQGRTVWGNGVSVQDGGPTSWQAVIETPRVGDSFREFLLEVQDSTLLYAPFQVGGNPMALLRPDTCKQHPEEPCGFCSLTGFCSGDPTTTCQIAAFGAAAPALPTPEAPNTTCGTCLFGLNPANANQPYLVACTPTHLKGCYYNQGQNSTLANVTPESCNFIPGIPSQAWTPLTPPTTSASASTPAPASASTPAPASASTPAPASAPAAAPATTPPATQATTQASTLSGPIDTNIQNDIINVEGITFRGSTNSFSFNYRDEPLYPRINSPSPSPTAPAPLAGRRGDLAFAYSSWPELDRPNPRGLRCSQNLNQSCGLSSACPSGMGSCEEVGFCSDNYALCTPSNVTLCGTAAACLTTPIPHTIPYPMPYPALTSGIEATDPFTPLLRGYAGDDVQIRVLIGAHINPHNFTLHGLNWLNQPSYVDSGWRNSQAMGISEHYNLLVKLDPPFTPPTGEAPLKHWMDYLYQPGAAAIEQAAGNWGLIRAYTEHQDDLWPLPQKDHRTGEAFKEVPVCPLDAPQRPYTVVALTAAQALGGPLVYNPTQGIGDLGALLFFDVATGGSNCTSSDWSKCQFSAPPEPLVLRAAAGECINVTLYNGIPFGGYCNTATQTTCTSNNVNTACTPVACTTLNGKSVCNNSTSTPCTTPASDCPQLACTALPYTACNTAPTTLCTPNNVNTVCTTPVACTTLNGNSVCNSSPATPCTTPTSDCPQLACTAQPFGYCNTAPLTLCTAANSSAVCTTQVACTKVNGNSVCNNSTATPCTTPASDCPQLACNALNAGVSSAQLQVLQTTVSTSTATPSCTSASPPCGASATTVNNSFTTGSTTTTVTTAEISPYTSNLSLQVGLRPQLVTADPRFSDGTNAGFNRLQTAPPGGSVTYTWYAGHIEPDYVDRNGNVETKYIPIEFGASNLLPPDPINQALHGLFGGLIIEPKGAWWYPPLPPGAKPPKPGTSQPAGVDAIVQYDGEHTFDEFVIFTPDDINLNKVATLTPGTPGFDLLNYSTEVLNGNNPPPRCCESGTSTNPISVACVLNETAPLFCNTSFSLTSTTTSTCTSCPPLVPATPTFCAHVGDKVRFRLLHPGGTNTNEVFELAGHTYLETPYETPPEACEAPTTHTNLFASQRMGEQNLCGSLEFLPKAMYRDYHTGRWGESLSEWKASRPMHGPSNHYDVLIDEAGGHFRQCGDYLYRSYPADHFGLGIWGIFRVWGCGEPPEPKPPGCQ
jgi:hypothetical protein